MESFFSSLKVERVARKIYRTRDQARADVFDYIERFYNPRRRHSTIGYLSPMEFEAKVAISLGWCLPNRQQLTWRWHKASEPRHCAAKEAMAAIMLIMFVGALERHLRCRSVKSRAATRTQSTCGLHASDAG